MKDLLFVLLYQAIVAVNTAVVIGFIIWLAKRKDEKDGGKPNPDFTPPPTRHSGGYQPKKSEMPKPPTTGTSTVKQKKRKYDKFSCLYHPFSNLTREQVIDGLDRYIKGFSPNDLLDRVENEIRKRIKDDQRTGTQPIQSFIGEVRGGPRNEVIGTVTAKSAEELEEKLKALSDTLDRTDKKPVTPERLKEAGFELEPVNVFNPAEESTERSETDFINAKCGDCKRYANGLYGGYCILRNEPVNSHERRRCYFFKKYEAPVRTTHICKNCKHYLATEEGAATGLCGMKDEITFGNNYSACFEKRGGKRP